MILRAIDDKATFYAFVLAYPLYWPIFDKFRSEFEMKFLLDLLFAKQIGFCARVPYLKATLKNNKPLTKDAASAIRGCHNLYTSDKPFTLSPDQRTALLSVREVVGWYWGEIRNGSACQELHQYRGAVYEENYSSKLVPHTLLRLDEEITVDVWDTEDWDTFLEMYRHFPLFHVVRSGTIMNNNLRQGGLTAYWPGGTITCQGTYSLGGLRSEG